jgi:hypothetical protein
VVADRSAKAVDRLSDRGEFFLDLRRQSIEPHARALSLGCFENSSSAENRTEFRERRSMSEYERHMIFVLRRVVGEFYAGHNERPGPR